MAPDNDPEDPRPATIRFGEMAVRKGYCTREQVREALREQRRLGARGRPRPLTGILMVRNGFISTGQLIDLLRTYQQQHAADADAEDEEED